MEIKNVVGRELDIVGGWEGYTGTVSSAWIEENISSLIDVNIVFDQAKMYADDDANSFTQKTYDDWRENGFEVLLEFREGVSGKVELHVTPHSKNDDPADEPWWIDSVESYLDESDPDELHILVEELKKQSL